MKTETFWNFSPPSEKFLNEINLNHFGPQEYRRLQMLNFVIPLFLGQKVINDSAFQLMMINVISVSILTGWKIWKVLIWSISFIGWPVLTADVNLVSISQWLLVLYGRFWWSENSYYSIDIAHSIDIDMAKNWVSLWQWMQRLIYSMQYSHSQSFNCTWNSYVQIPFK